MYHLQTCSIATHLWSIWLDSEYQEYDDGRDDEDKEKDGDAEGLLLVGRTQLVLHDLPFQPKQINYSAQEYFYSLN